MKLWAQEVIKRVEQQAAVSSSRPNPDEDFPLQIDPKEIESISSC